LWWVKDEKPEFVLSHPSLEKSDGWGTHSLWWVKDEKPEFVLSHPSLEKSDGWGTHFLWIGESALWGVGSCYPTHRQKKAMDGAPILCG
jgi:hypothetical protein